MHILAKVKNTALLDNATVHAFYHEGGKAYIKTFQKIK